MARTVKATATKATSTRKVIADSGGSSVVEVTVADEYKNHSSIMVGSVELKIIDGKLTVSKELSDYLKKAGYVK